MQSLRVLVLGAAFVAATLQGSRLPVPDVDAGERLAVRASSGAEPPPQASVRNGALA
jgi:hypothetical protein